MSVAGCKWPGCERHDGRAWCEEHYRLLAHHIRVMIARGDSGADVEALAWIRVTFDAGAREKWDPGRWERLVRWVRDRDAARARRGAILVAVEGDL